MLIGVLLISFGCLVSSFIVNNFGRLFAITGVSIGLGISLAYIICNSLPVQWFSNKLGIANSLVKLGKGIGFTVLAVIY